MNPADLTWDPAAEQSVLGSILLSILPRIRYFRDMIPAGRLTGVSRAE